MNDSPREPAAEIRQMASALRQIYIALTMEGFTEQQALIVIGQMLIASNEGNR